MAHVLPESIFIKYPTSHFIGGKWAKPAADTTIEIVSAHTEQVSAVVAEAREAVEAAYVAQVGAPKSFAPFAVAEGIANFAKYADIGDHYA
jgi:acyl-CoA reductase-like NAD-dependent aldehyde dehydrogenase